MSDSGLNVPGFPDLFFGDEDKEYLDFIARDVTRIRGLDVEYYVLRDTTQSVDGKQPISDKDDIGDPFFKTNHTGNVSIYGEPVLVSENTEGYKREITPDWDYDGPHCVRGVVLDLSTEEDPDERGTVFTRTATIHFARILMDEAGIRPQRGDVVRLNSKMNEFFNVEDVSRDASRFGATGFFTNYDLSLIKTTKFDPTRKQLPQNLENN